MEGSRCREVGQNHFRLPSGFSFHSKLKESESVSGSSDFVSNFHGLLPPPPPHGGIHSGLFGHPTQGKPSFSIDALLGLTETREDGHTPLLINFRAHHHTHQGHFHEEGSKAKLSLRYGPYKRERKTALHQTEGCFESKESPGRSGKAKRVRTIFTPEQLEKLESEFERQQYMVGTERSYLAESLDLTEAQVKVWFQNRRIKWRKVHLEMQQERLRAIRSQEAPEFDSSSDSNLSRIESSFVSTRGGAEGDEGPRGLEDMDRTGGSTWGSGGGFDMDAYLLKTLGSVGGGGSGQWRSGGQGTSDESDTESE